MAAHHILGHSGQGDLILMAGPNYQRMVQMAAAAEIDTIEAKSVDDIEALKTRVNAGGRSVVIIASVPEIEGELDRSSFDRHLVDIAYAVDRVIYAGLRGAVVVWPVADGTRMLVRNGQLQVRQNIGTVHAGSKIVGLKVDRL